MERESIRSRAHPTRDPSYASGVGTYLLLLMLLIAAFYVLGGSFKL